MIEVVVVSSAPVALVDGRLFGGGCLLRRKLRRHIERTAQVILSALSSGLTLLPIVVDPGGRPGETVGPREVGRWARGPATGGA